MASINEADYQTLFKYDIFVTMKGFISLNFASVKVNRDFYYPGSNPGITGGTIGPTKNFNKVDRQNATIEFNKLESYLRSLRTQLTSVDLVSGNTTINPIQENVFYDMTKCDNGSFDGTLYFDGKNDPNSQFFIYSSDMIYNEDMPQIIINSKFSLVNGAKFENIFWLLDGYVNLGDQLFGNYVVFEPQIRKNSLNARFYGGFCIPLGYEPK